MELPTDFLSIGRGSVICSLSYSPFTLNSLIGRADRLTVRVNQLAARVSQLAARSAGYRLGSASYHLESAS